MNKETYKQLSSLIRRYGYHEGINRCSLLIENDGMQILFRLSRQKEDLLEKRETIVKCGRFNFAQYFMSTTELVFTTPRKWIY